jgi:hypothetical protein
MMRRVNEIEREKREIIVVISCSLRDENWNDYN